jgi:hypothetical protein
MVPGAIDRIKSHTRENDAIKRCVKRCLRLLVGNTVDCFTVNSVCVGRRNVLLNDEKYNIANILICNTVTCYQHQVSGIEHNCMNYTFMQVAAQ